MKKTRKALNLVALIGFLGSNFLSPLSYAVAEREFPQTDSNSESQQWVDVLSEEGNSTTDVEQISKIEELSFDKGASNTNVDTAPELMNGEAEGLNEWEEIPSAEAVSPLSKGEQNASLINEETQKVLGESDNDEDAEDLAELTPVEKWPMLMSAWDTQLNRVEWVDFHTISIARPEWVTDTWPAWFTIMDRNLWATTNDISSGASYWYHYQWWNNYWFSQSLTTWDDSEYFSEDRATYDDYWPTNPYNNSKFRWWSSMEDYWGTSNTDNYDNLWWWSGDLGTNNWWLDTITSSNITNRQWPCPSGYHVPSAWEWWLLVKYWAYASWYNDYLGWISWMYYVEDYSTTSTAFSFMEYFKLPFAGYRDYYDASVHYQGDYGYYWSSSPVVDFDNTASFMNLSLYSFGSEWHVERAYGYSVRCFKNTYEAPTISYSLELHANSGVVAEDTLETDSEWKVTLPNATRSADENGEWIFEWWFAGEWVSERIWNSWDVITLTADMDVYAHWAQTITIRDPANPLSGFTIMDRNLWATTDDITSADSYGFHYQWWNNYGFLQSLDKTANPEYFSWTRAIYDDYRPSNPYNNPVFRWWSGMYDYWDTSNDHYDNLWWWGDDEDYSSTANANWLYRDSWNSRSERQWPCPEWYHVPSAWEWSKLSEYWIDTNLDKFTYELSTQQSYNNLKYFNNCAEGSSYICYDADNNVIECDNVDEISYIECNEYDDTIWEAFAGDFNIPFAGNRNHYYASLYNQGARGYYWSSSPYGVDHPDRVRYMDLDSSRVKAANVSNRALGFSVRCFKDSYVAPTNTYTLTFDSQSGSEVASRYTIPEQPWSRPANPTRDGYTFVDWYTSTWYETAFDFSTPATENLTVYAKWSKDCWTGVYFEEMDVCATKSNDNLVYYWIDENGKDVISIISWDIILTMLDKNQWASVAWTWADSYGELYQRWNNAPIKSATAVENERAEYENYWPWHSFYDENFRYGSSMYDYWQDDIHYDNLWWWSGDDTAWDWWWINNWDTRQWPCDTWYHVPSIMEWESVLQMFASSVGQNLIGSPLHYFSNSTNAWKFRNAFLLPLAGGRRYYNASLYDQGSYGYYWSSSPGYGNSDRTRYFYLSSSNVNADNVSIRAYGYSVRCFKDSSNAPQTLTLTFDINGGGLSWADSEWKLIQKVESWKLAQEPVKLARDGYVFDTWYTSTWYETPFDFSTPLTGDMTVYAKWNDELCPGWGTYSEELDICYTSKSADDIVYYWTDENGKDVISIKDPDSNTILTILDKNQWATDNDITNVNSYWELYQRWNNAPIKSAQKVENERVEYANYWPWHPFYDATFRYGNGMSDYWQDNKHYDNLWWWSGDTSNNASVDTFWWWIKNWETRQWPCDTWYHVPSQWEWNALVTYWYNTKNSRNKKPLTTLNVFTDSTFKKDFKLPLAGSRDYKDAIQDDIWVSGLYWSSSPYISTNPNHIWYLYIASSDVDVRDYNIRADGFSVRCFKDSTDALDTIILTFDINGGELSWADSEWKLIQKVKSWELAQEPIKFARDGYDFIDWYTSWYETIFNFSTPITENMNIYAKWNEVYTITYNLDWWTESLPNPTTYTVESWTFWLYQPTKSGYMFLWWTGSNWDSPNANIYITQWSTWNRTYNAVWWTYEDIDAYFISSTWAISYITLMDRNMWAFNDDISSTGSYWFKYQWWNNQGFQDGCWTHSCSDTVSVNATPTKVDWNPDYDNSNYWGTRFVRWDTDHWTDYWSDSIPGSGNHMNLWWWWGDTSSNQWWLTTMTAENITNRQWPCTEWYHVPSVQEMNRLMIYRYNAEKNANRSSSSLTFVEWTGIWMEFAGTFNIPFAGYRDYSSAKPSYQVSNAYLWSSSSNWATSTEGRRMQLTDEVLKTSIGQTRSYTLSVRCFSNDYLFSQPSMTIDAKWWTWAMILVEWNKIKSLWTPHRANSIFSGWYDADTQWNKIETWNDAPTNLYARWICEEWYVISGDACVLENYTITYNLDWWTESLPNPTTYTVISWTFWLYQPTKSGYMFLWWTWSNGDETNANIYITEWSTWNRTYNAVWWTFEDIDAYFILSTWAVSYVTLMDRNMWASMTWAGFEANTGSYWFHYQWWNNNGFQIWCWGGGRSDSVTENATGTKAIWNSVYNNKWYNGYLFITWGNSYWKQDQNYDWLWWWADDIEGSYNWWLDIITSSNITNRQWPCPEWYHVPSAGERWFKITYNLCEINPEECSYGMEDADPWVEWNENLRDIYFSYSSWLSIPWLFNIPYAWYRNSDGLISRSMSYIYLTSSPGIKMTNSWWVLWLVHYFNWWLRNDKNGSVRCFKNDYLFTQPSMIIHPNGWTWAMILVEADKIKTLWIPHRANSIFSGWYDADIQWNKIETWNDAPANLYARWICEEWYIEVNNECVQTFTVTFDANTNGWTTTTGEELIASWTILDLSNYTATKIWWTFTWWNIDSWATEPMPNLTVTWTATLYAIFSKTLTVTYATWTWVSEISKNSDSCTLYNTDASCIVVATDITLSEWYTTWVWSNWVYTINPWEDITLTEDDTYTAIASTIKYSIAYNLEWWIIEWNNPEEYTIESWFTLINPTKDDYVFAWWIGTNLSIPTIAVTIPVGTTWNLSYTANWEEDFNHNEEADSTEVKKVVEFLPWDHGTLQWTTRYEILPWLTLLSTWYVEPTKVANPWYVFSGWDKVIDTTSPIIGDITYTAIWWEDKNGNGINDETEDHFKLEFTWWENWTLSGETIWPGILTWLTIDEAWITIPEVIPNSGYVFSGWEPEITGWTVITSWMTFTPIYWEDKNGNGINDEEETKYKVTVNYVYSRWWEASPSVSGMYLSGIAFNYVSPNVQYYTANSWIVSWMWIEQNQTFTVIYTPNTDKNNNGIADEIDGYKPWGWGSGGWGGWWGSSSNTGSAWWQTWSQINSNTGDTVSSWANNQQPNNTTGSNVQTWNQTPQNNNNTGQNTISSGSEKSTVWNADYPTEFQEAYKFSKENWITTMPTIQKAQMNSPLTRIAMAKMLSQYAINILWKKPKNTVVPIFNDVTEKMDSDYENWVTLAYQLWIMWQNMQNNNFRPNDEVTRAEFVTALSRLLYNTSDWKYKSTAEYYVNHMKKLKQEWIITKDDPIMKEKRWYVMIMLMRSVK